MNHYVFPENCKTVIDVTKPPYCADNTGKTDCTKILCKIVDDIMSAYLNAFNETDAKLSAMSDPNALISFEIRKVDGRKNVIFPEKLPPSKIIYFPKGTYLVSDTVSYSFEEFRNILGDLRHLEMNCQLRFLGESTDDVVIKLKDNCKGFEHGNDRPVISFIQGEQSNIAMTNMLENLTVNVGRGNPGATGVRYFANNTGAVRNVKIISEDLKGNTGFSVLNEKISACYVKNLEVVGFNYGIKVTPQTIYTVFEHITLKQQNRVGFYVGDTVVSIRDLKSENLVPALRLVGPCGFTTLMDAVLTGGNPIDNAIKHESGQFFLRNVRSKGYGCVIAGGFNYIDGFTDYVEEYCSDGPVNLFEKPENLKTLNLAVEETPDLPWDSPENWAFVEDFGAVGDGIHDDSDAIEKALNSGKSTVYFGSGIYLLDRVIEIPKTVNRINFMYCDLASGKNLSRLDSVGAFKVSEFSETPLIIEDLFAFEKFYGFMSFLEHASKRTVVFSDVHVQAASIYFNTVSGGKVFMENTGCTIGGIPGAGVRTQKLPGEEKFPYDRNKPNFMFVGQKVYCRQINPERSLHEVINDGGTLFVLGCKTEEEGTAYETRNGGSTEVYGAVFCIGLNKEYPAIINDNSSVCVFAATSGMSRLQVWPIAAKETQNNETKLLKREQLPIRYMVSNTIPLYIGKK